MIQLVFLLLAVPVVVISQENAGTNVATSLVECYNDTLYSTRDYKLPSTINTLIELIRKIEDGNTNQDARVISSELLQRFRQDGILKTKKAVEYGIPYAPNGWESGKNQVQLKFLTPGNAINFQNDSLNTVERCSLHSMISSTIELSERGDESMVCNKISRYTSRVHKRSTQERIEDLSKQGTRSECPLEGGVLYTRWGAVKSGLVLAGIAAGLNKQTVISNNVRIDNRYASTIAGEFSEAALNQAVPNPIVGTKGGWNSTMVPKTYFLESSIKENLYLTDAEIRGGLDGLYLAITIDKLKSQAPNIKISQILDMYYSRRGVLNNTIKACNRKQLQTTFTTTEDLVRETTNFNHLLNENVRYSYTPNPEQFPKQATDIVNAFNTYLPSLNDVQCDDENIPIERTSTDLIIVLDTTWDYKTIQPFISYVLDNLDINKFESSYTVVTSFQPEPIVNLTRRTSDFHELYNLTQHQRFQQQFDFNQAIQRAEILVKGKLDNETAVTGQSSIVLFLTHSTPNDVQSEYARQRRNDVHRRYLPDMRILVAGNGARESYSGFVSNVNSDVFQIPETNDENSLKTAANSLLERIRKLPRSVVNPKCTSSFKSGENNFDVVQFVEPNAVNYHKISPNYFHNGQSPRRLKVRGQGYGTLTVCTSRNEPNPRNSSASSCKMLNSDELSLDISGYCGDKSTLDCAPIYISVEGTTSNIRCQESLCRFPDSIKYVITMEGTGCSGDSVQIIATFALVLTTLLFNFIWS